MSTIKQPAERLVYSYDFNDKLGAETIVPGAAGIVSAVSVARTGLTTLTKVSQSHAQGIVSVAWEGGTDGICYLTTVVIEDSAGQNHEIDGEIRVINLGFSLPVGITSTYLTAEEYVDRFGAEETIRLTDQHGTDTVGAALGKALVSAASLIESYIGGRYTLPFDEIPEVLKDIAADLARERLHTLYPAEEVTKRADRARATLKDISKGIVILVVANALIEESGADQPETYAPDQIFTNAVLSSYRGRLNT